MTVVYRHIRKDKNQPFYIGIGSKYRANTKHERNSIWNRIVSKTGYFVEILFEYENREDAMKKESELIALYGRINNNTGTLSNMTDGGEGAVGSIFTKERRERMSKKYSGKGNPRARGVYSELLDMKFDTISECASFLGLSQPYISRMIIGIRSNKYNLKYV